MSVHNPAACPPSPELTRNSGWNRASRSVREGTVLLSSPRGTLSQPELGMSQHGGEKLVQHLCAGIISSSAVHPSISNLGQRS